MKINIKKLDADAVLPTRGSSQAAGYDLYAKSSEDTVIPPHKTVMVGTGLAMEIPEGYFVIFLDNNQMNFDISNLYCVNRKIHVIMSKNKWYTNNKENTLTAIKWCELYYVLKNNKKNI